MTTKKFGAVALGAAMVLSQFSALPAYACEYDWCGGGEGDDNSVYIKINNSGSISNTTEAKADTGDNKAGGSYGGDGGSAGDGGEGGGAGVEGGGAFDWCGECAEGGDNSVANGGSGGDGGNANGGDGGEGGLVVTGDAEANAGSVNTLNTTEVEVEGCGCEDDQDECECIPPWFRRGEDNSVTIKINNSGSISNTTEAKADTGDNKAKGSYGGDGGSAGDGGDGGGAGVEGDDGEGCGCEWDLGNGGGTANGGDGADGGDADGGDGDVGGTVQTGDARSDAGTINVMNTVLVRVVR